MEHLISVIVPCYNVESYLPRCIDSIINQMYQKIEIILVDDGSTDNTGSICDSYANRDHRIIVIHQKNRGLSGARNTGIENAKGKYLYFIDSDDYIFRNSISDLYEIAMTYGAELVSGEYIKSKEIIEECCDTRETVKVGEGAVVLDYILQEASWSAWGKLYDKSLVGNDRFLEGYYYEDLEFVPRQYMKAKKAAHYCKQLYFYYDRNTGIMGSTGNRLKPYYIDFIRNNMQLVNNSDCSNEMKESLCAGFLMRTIWDYARSFRVNGISQEEDFKKVFILFINDNYSSIIHNNMLPVKYKLCFYLCRRSISMFDYGLKILYKWKSHSA